MTWLGLNAGRAMPLLRERRRRVHREGFRTTLGNCRVRRQWRDAELSGDWRLSVAISVSAAFELQYRRRRWRRKPDRIKSVEPYRLARHRPDSVLSADVTSGQALGPYPHKAK